jgi:hypothetical protein
LFRIFSTAGGMSMRPTLKSNAPHPIPLAKGEGMTI